MTHDGEFDDAVFQVAATFPMEKMRTGVVREGLPFDVDEFVKQIWSTGMKNICYARIRGGVSAKHTNVFIALFT